MKRSLPARDIVLIGAGHTNLHVVRRWMTSPLPDFRLTVVSPMSSATYSGMLPGCLAGLYEPGDMLIDLWRLCGASGTRLIVDTATSLDPARRQVQFAERPPVRFDIASIGIGSIPVTCVEVAQHPGFVSIKPMYTFPDRLAAVLQRSDSGTLSVAVIGAGAAGVEIAFCIRHLLKRRNLRAQIRLLEAGPRILPGFRDKTARLTFRELQARGIEVQVQCRVAMSVDNILHCTDGKTIDADLVLWCVGAEAPAFLSRTGLPCSAAGFISVEPTLLSVSGEPVFAVGDSAELSRNPLPRAGVYAVRQGPVLFENLNRLATGKSLVPFRPQADFLRLLATGDGTAIGQYYGLSGHGRWLWNLKHRIDSRFMDMHRPGRGTMSSPGPAPEPSVRSADTPSDDPGLMRCAGCGGKTSARVLASVLDELRTSGGPIPCPDFLQPGDAAILSPAVGPVDAVSVDFFEAFVDDPWLTGRIAALHAMSDLWASGTTPSAAVAMITLPNGALPQQQELLRHVLSGAIREFRLADVVLTGGHTVDGESLYVGFTVLGKTGQHAPFTKAGLVAGQQLVLTKSLGTGVILAAAARNAASARGMDAALALMLHSNQPAAEVARSLNLTSVTDVTGFGLAGHLFEMLDASSLSARVRLSAVPLISGAAELFASGIRSSLDPENRSVENRIVVQSPEMKERPEWQALFDPQTAGGLLLAVDSASLDPLLVQLRTAGCPDAVCIGEVIDTGRKSPELIVEQAVHLPGGLRKPRA